VPGKKAEWANEGLDDLGRRRVHYAREVGKIWVPEPEIAKGLRGTGSQKFGGEAIERCVGSQYYSGDGTQFHVKNGSFPSANQMIQNANIARDIFRPA
jgi:hypothetical protein